MLQKRLAACEEVGLFLNCQWQYALIHLGIAKLEILFQKFVTTDILFSNAALHKYLPQSVIQLFLQHYKCRFAQKHFRLLHENHM